MDVFICIVLAFCVGNCYGQNTQKKRKVDMLQLKVENLYELAFALRLDIDDLQSWRNGTVTSRTETRVIDSDKECVDSHVLGHFEHSLDVMEGRLSYIIKGLMGEKISLREMLKDTRAEVRQKIETTLKEVKVEMQKAFDEKLKQQMLTTESKFKEGNEMEKAFDAKLIQHMLTIESKFREEKNQMHEAFDAKLNHLKLTTESKVAEINERLNRTSRQLEIAEHNGGASLQQLEVVPNLSDAMSTTVKDDMGIMKHQTEQYYFNMKQDGWLQYNSYLYKLFEQYAYFDAAVNHCQDEDASLVEVTDQEEFQFLSDSFKGFNFWVGATDRQTEGEWRWSSGPLMKVGSWGPGEPNNHGSGQDCLVMGAYPPEYYDTSCSYDYYYVCKLQ